jgi:hypothetical protein
MAKTKKDNTEIEQKALTAFDIANELKTITTKIIEADGVLEDGDYEALNKWQASLEVKAESIGHVKERIDAEAALYKSYEEKAKSRRKACENAAENLRKYLASCMATAGIKSIKKQDGLFSISLCDGRESVVIDDVKALPLDCVEERVVIEAKKDIIKSKLAAGEMVDGAHIETSAPYVTIR